MIGNLFKALVVILVIAGAAGSGYFWNETKKRDQVIVSLEKEVEAGKKRNRAIQKKYTQEKAKVGTCMRMKMAEEAKKNKYMKMADSLTAEKQVLISEKEALEKKHKAGIGVWEKKLQAVNIQKEKLTKRYEALVEKYKSLAQADREKIGKIRELEGEKKGLESDIVLLEKKLERNKKNNERLSVIAEELTEKYRQKAGKGIEPLTKIGMIELEHLLQEYIKRIDKEKLVEQ